MTGSESGIGLWGILEGVTIVRSRLSITLVPGAGVEDVPLLGVFLGAAGVVFPFGSGLAAFQKYKNNFYI